MNDEAVIMPEVTKILKIDGDKRGKDFIFSLVSEEETTFSFLATQGDLLSIQDAINAALNGSDEENN